VCVCVCVCVCALCVSEGNIQKESHKDIYDLIPNL
jgi:hypothetical protein